MSGVSRATAAQNTPEALVETLARQAAGRAQSPTAPGQDFGSTGQGRVVPGPVDPNAYVVGPGDVFDLHLMGAVGETITLRVSPEGTVFLPGYGTVAVAGLSLTDMRTRVSGVLSGRMRSVSWTLELVQARRMRIYVTGDVQTPGPMDLSATSRVSDALPPSALTKTGSRRNVRVLRRDGSTEHADLELFTWTGSNDANPYLRDGDILNVPSAVEWVHAYGALARPGRFELGPRDSLLTLIELAGGPLPATLAERALLIRWREAARPESVFFSLGDVYSRTFNPSLQDGDRVYLYYLPSYRELYQATIRGEVERPGTYPITLGRTRLSDLVRAAGGFRPGADLAGIRLYRGGTTTDAPDQELDRLLRLSRSEMTEAEYEQLRSRLVGKRQDFRVDWTRLQQQPELDLLLDRSDIIEVDPVLATVRVEGEVRRPGLVQYDPAHRVEDYVRLAGGLSNRAASGKIVVQRAITGQTLPARDVPALVPGDLIWVPLRPERTLWQNIGTLIAVAAQVATVVIAVRSVN